MGGMNRANWHPGGGAFAALNAAGVPVGPGGGYGYLKNNLMNPRIGMTGMPVQPWQGGTMQGIRPNMDYGRPVSPQGMGWNMNQDGGAGMQMPVQPWQGGTPQVVGSGQPWRGDMMQPTPSPMTQQQQGDLTGGGPYRRPDNPETMWNPRTGPQYGQMGGGQFGGIGQFLQSPQGQQIMQMLMARRMGGGMGGDFGAQGSGQEM